MGYLYCADFGEFVKVGKTLDFETRMKSLISTYGFEPIDYFISDELKNYSELEVILHKELDRYRISNEKYNIDFKECIEYVQYMEIRQNLLSEFTFLGFKTLFDHITGYMEVTDIIKHLKLNKFDNSLLEQIKNETGKEPYFSYRGGKGMFCHPTLVLETCIRKNSKLKFEIYKTFKLKDILKTQ